MAHGRAADFLAVYSVDMPDLTIAVQTRLFMMAWGFGFLLGVAYDLCRILRLTITRGRIAVFIVDILYFLAAGLSVFLFMLAYNQGEFRFYLILGIIFGFLIYYFTFGAFILKWSNRTIRLLRRVLRAILHAFMLPILWLERLFQRCFARIRSSVPGKLKNFKVKSKICLKR